MKAILDAGALVAVDRRNRLIGVQLRVLQQQGTPIWVSSAVVGQVWRDGRKQANLARVLAGVGIEALGEDDGKRIGELLALSGSADIVDAHVALITAPADLVSDQRSRRHPQATASSRGFGAGPDRLRLLDPANLRFQRYLGFRSLVGRAPLTLGGWLVTSAGGSYPKAVTGQFRRWVQRGRRSADAIRSPSSTWQYSAPARCQTAVSPSRRHGRPHWPPTRERPGPHPRPGHQTVPPDWQEPALRFAGYTARLSRMEGPEPGSQLCPAARAGSDPSVVSRE